MRKLLNTTRRPLKIKKLIYNNDNSLNMACSLNHLRLDYNSFGNYEKSIKYYESLNIKINIIYNNNNHLYVVYKFNLRKNDLHLNIACSLNNLRLAYNSFGNHEMAVKLF